MAEPVSSPADVRLPLRTKFIAGVALLTLILAAFIIISEQVQIRRMSTELTAAQGSSIADTIESTAGYYVIFGLSDDLKGIAEDLARNESVEYADFVSAEGKILAATDASRIPAAFRTSKPARSSARRATAGALQLFVRPFFETRADASNAAATPRGYFRLAVNQRAAEKTFRDLTWGNLLILALALLFGFALATAAARLIVRPVATIVQSATRIATGDLTARADVKASDEIGSLARAFNQMAVTLQKTISRITGSQMQLNGVVETVGSRSRIVMENVDSERSVLDEAYYSIDKLNSGIRKITENVESLSASSEETSSSMLEMVASMEEVSRHTDSLFESVEETASASNEMVSSINEVDQNVEYLQNFVTETSTSMVEMGASINQVESNAAKSYDLALAVADAAESGMGAVRQTIEGMEEIRQAVLESDMVVTKLGERSAEIGKILNVIDDVAEQTNLLALNAAILAAQASSRTPSSRSRSRPRAACRTAPSDARSARARRPSRSSSRPSSRRRT